MALNFLLGDSTSFHTHDQFSFDKSDSNACRVRIYCHNKKKTLYAMLSGGFQLDVASKWKDFFNGGVGSVGGPLLDTLDNLHQIFSGGSIRQPWFGRKYWEGTTPLMFTLPLQFVSFSNAYEEVYLPMVDLLSLVYPREDGKALGGFLNQYSIPGPTLFYGTNDEMSSGDAVEFSIGKFLTFKRCYIDKVSCSIENSFSTDGYPHNVKADICFTTMDVSYVKNSGEFMEDGFEDAAIPTDALFDKTSRACRGLRHALDTAGDAVRNMRF